MAPVTSIAPVASAEHVPVTAAEHGNAEGVLYVPTVIVAAPWPPRAGQ
jgi:hypothetical protein